MTPSAGLLLATLRNVSFGLDVVEEALKVVSSGDLADAPFPLAGREAQIHLDAKKHAYLHVLEMCSAESLKTWLAQDLGRAHDEPTLLLKLQEVVQGLEVVEVALKTCTSGDLSQATFPLVADEARLQLEATAGAYLHALEMCNSTSVREVLAKCNQLASGDTEACDASGDVALIPAESPAADRDVLAKRYCSCANWRHVFVGTREESVRWIFDREIRALIAAQVQDGDRWINLDSWPLSALQPRIAEIADSVAIHGMKEWSQLPSWAAVDAREVAQAAAIEALANAGYFAGARKPEVKPDFPGSFMVSDPLDSEGYAIVGDDLESLALEARGHLVETISERHLVVDGLDEAGCFAGDGERAPFVVFDVDAQGNIAGPFASRDLAEKHRDEILAGHEPRLDAKRLTQQLADIDEGRSPSSSVKDAGAEVTLIRAAVESYRELMSSPTSADRAANGDDWADQEIRACDALLQSPLLMGSSPGAGELVELGPLDQGLHLRNQALSLLQAAQDADGLKAFTVMHTHSFGASTYVLWAAEKPSEELAQAVLDEKFEPERDETILVEDCFTLQEMTGVANTSRLHDLLERDESVDHYERPSF